MPLGRDGVDMHELKSTRKVDRRLVSENSGRFKAKFGPVQPNTHIEQGIAQFVEWYRQYHEV